MYNRSKTSKTSSGADLTPRRKEGKRLKIGIKI